MDLALASMRRAARRLATVAVVLYASSGVLATATVCLPGPHRHDGVPAPECVMHHAEGHHAGAHDTSLHAHHAAPAAPAPALTCACGEARQALQATDASVPWPAVVFTPVLIANEADANLDSRLATIDPHISTPPPRA